MPPKPSNLSLAIHAYRRRSPSLRNAMAIETLGPVQRETGCAFRASRHLIMRNEQLVSYRLYVVSNSKAVAQF